MQYIRQHLAHTLAHDDRKRIEWSQRIVGRAWCPYVYSSAFSPCYSIKYIHYRTTAIAMTTPCSLHTIRICMWMSWWKLTKESVGHAVFTCFECECASRNRQNYKSLKFVKLSLNVSVRMCFCVHAIAYCLYGYWWNRSSMSPDQPLPVNCYCCCHRRRPFRRRYGRQRRHHRRRCQHYRCSRLPNILQTILSLRHTRARTDTICLLTLDSFWWYFRIFPCPFRFILFRFGYSFLEFVCWFVFFFCGVFLVPGYCMLWEFEGAVRFNAFALRWYV